MKKLILLASALMVCGASATTTDGKKFVTVAVIDTGLEKDIMKQGYSKGICKMGHKDLTGKGLNDTHGHGTNISGLIHKYAKGLRYCQVILKYYLEDAESHENMNRMVQAIRYAVDIKVDFINISGGGAGFSAYEKEIVLRALKRNTVVVAAAGNEKCNLDTEGCEYFPAVYDERIIVVGNGTTEENRSPTSNWGSIVDFWEDGDNKKGEYGPKMSGTSQATAIRTGKLVRKHVQSRRHTKNKVNRSEAPVRGLQGYDSL